MKQSSAERDFQPFFRNPHVQTIAGNFWPRRIDQRRFPPLRKPYKIDAQTTILAFEHQPEVPSRGQVAFLHGLESSASAGYILSFAQQALLRGFGVHRINLRTCGGTEELCETVYHSGLTSDTRFVVEEIQKRNLGPIFLVGFSLGGNIALKLLGELGQTSLIAGACAISTPIDIAPCVRQCIDKPSNFLYARRFLNELRGRVRRKNKLAPHLYNTAGLREVKNIWDFDDRFTARFFGFGTAANYYSSQSSARFLDAIRVPTLVVCAKDDPLVPFDIYDHPAFQANPALTLLAPEHGGHLGFLSRREPRFWVDAVALDWMDRLLRALPNEALDARRLPSPRNLRSGFETAASA